MFAGSVDWRRATSFHLQIPFAGPFGALTSAMAGLYLIGFAAPAFEAAACHVGETIDPGRNVPRAMFASAGVATIYFAVIPVIWLGVLGPAPLAGKLVDVLGPTFAPMFGAGAKAAAVWFMVFNMFNGTLTPITGVARTLSQLSEDGLLPRVLARRSRTDVPWVASTFTATMAIAFLVGGDPVWVLAAANFTYLIGISLPSVAVWLLRTNEPDRPRLYRAPKGTIVCGLVAASAWGVSTVFGFEQFGLPTVLAGLGLAYSGTAAYAWRRWRDRAGAPRTVKRSLHLKLTGAMLLVLVLDGAGYLVAVDNVSRAAPALTSVLQDIFVAVAILTITVGLVLPGMIAHGATEVAEAADRLVKGTLAELTRAMRALAAGDLTAARATVETRHVDIRSADEIGAMAASFNVIVDEAGRAARSLDGAREALLDHRLELEALVAEHTAHGTQQAAVAELGRSALRISDIASIVDFALVALCRGLRVQSTAVIQRGEMGGPVSARMRSGSEHEAEVYELTPADRERLEAMFSEQVPLRLTPDGCEELCGPSVQRGPGAWATIATQRVAFGGFVAVADQPTRVFSDGDLSFIGSIASVVGSAVDRIRVEQELTHQALHDPLTGLPNRVLFADRLGLALVRMRRNPSVLAVLFVDVDQFKVINDSLGHEQGDRLLVMIAKRLQDAVRLGDTVARFGGDEFVILAEQLLDSSEAVAIAERIQAAAAEPIVLEGRDHLVSVSTGIAICSTPDVQVVDLLRDADAAMYQAKAQGRNSSAVFADAMRARAVHRFETELELRAGILGGQLRVHYQPIVHLASGSITGVEALVRWDHPTRGLVAPAEFIAIAEETGLIVALGEWVLGESCRQTQRWRQQPQLAHLTVSVNLSGRQIAQSDLTTTVANVLATSGLDPSHLILEITESVLMDDAETSITILNGLKRLGVRLGIDDFGTAYSSLRYLRKFPVDILKIDRSFVDGLGTEDDASAIVLATVNLAHSLGLLTIGEGVATNVQLRELTRLGCDEAQGYLFSTPRPADDIITTLLSTELHRPANSDSQPATRHAADAVG